MHITKRNGCRNGWASAVICLACLTAGLTPARSAEPASDLSPAALAISTQSSLLYIAASSAAQLLTIDFVKKQVTQRLSLNAPPSGLVLSADEKRLYVTCAGPVSRVCIVDPAANHLLESWPAGHTALSPVLSADGQSLFVCNRFNDAVSVYDLPHGREVVRIPVAREPVSAALTADNRFLLVANHLPRGRSDVPYVAATVSVIDTQSRRVVKELKLANGSINLRQLCVSPDGRYACVPQSIGRFQVPVTHISRGWVNTSALTLIDLRSLDVLNTVLLDEPDRGAANPWGAAWSPDTHWLCVTHAGTHELSVIDFPALLNKLAALPAKPPATGQEPNPDRSSTWSGEVPNDLSFLCGLRHRVQLQGNGPRALALHGNVAFVAGFFSDSLEAVELSSNPRLIRSIPLVREDNPTNSPAHSQRRLGERYFNDANLCFQGWQSCASCHDDDGRIDGLNWDLLNDGIGNPKDTKSLLWSHRTPPVMSLGVRATAQSAVRSGIQNSLSSSLPEQIALAIDEWLASLEPQPSPHLVNGRPSEAARPRRKNIPQLGNQLLGLPRTTPIYQSPELPRGHPECLRQRHRRSRHPLIAGALAHRPLPARRLGRHLARGSHHA